MLYTNRENFTGYLYLCNFDRNNSLKTVSLRLSRNSLKSSKKAERKFPLERLLIYSKSWKFYVITLLWNSQMCAIPEIIVNQGRYTNSYVSQICSGKYGNPGKDARLIAKKRDCPCT